MTRFATFTLLAAATALAAGGCKKPPDDSALAQGEWAVVDIDLPADVKPGARQTMEGAKELVVVVRGNRFTVTHPKEKGSLSASFTLDQTKAPREIDVFDLVVTSEGAEESPPTGTTRGIYKLTGDELVLALSMGQEKDLARPTAFEPLMDKTQKQGVLVFHLKRK